MVDRLGDLQCHRTDPARFGFVVDEPKLNGRGFLHAGALSTIADVVIGHSLASTAIGDVRFVTTALEIHFLGAGRRGEWIEVSVTPVRIGGRQAVGTAMFTNAGRRSGSPRRRSCRREPTPTAATVHVGRLAHRLDANSDDSGPAIGHDVTTVEVAGEPSLTTAAAWREQCIRGKEGVMGAIEPRTRR